MKVTKKMCKVIADIEYIIGSECYNPNSYDGWNMTLKVVISDIPFHFLKEMVNIQKQGAISLNHM